MENNSVSQQAVEFLEELFNSTGLQLNVKVRHSVSGDILDMDGPDAELLQAQTGEVLEALQHLLNQIYSRGPGSARIVCDVHGFRATREAELQAMANLAATRVRKSGMPFTFEPMSANERRIIHLTLTDQDDLFTESLGEGNDRKLKVGLKRSPK